MHLLQLGLVFSPFTKSYTKQKKSPFTKPNLKIYRCKFLDGVHPFFYYSLESMKKYSRRNWSPYTLQKKEVCAQLFDL